MRFLLLLCYLTVLHTGEAASPGWDALPESARSLVDGILISNRVLEPELDAEAARRAFVDLVAACRQPVGAADPQAAIAHLNRTILTGRKVGYLSRQYWRDCSFAAALLRKQANCLATTTLYVAVGRALGLPIKAVFVPQHAFACWVDAGSRFNLETTSGGSIVPDLTYLSRFAVDDAGYFGWMTPADDARLLAELHLVAARHLAGQQRLDEAQASLALARAAMPHRADLELEGLGWKAQASGDRAPLIAAAERHASAARAPRATVLAGVRTLAEDHRIRLDRTAERAALQRAYGLAPWHEQDEILLSLSLCLRGLRDHTGAALCMELSVARDPTNIYKRAWLAGMLSEAARLDEALVIMVGVRRENPEEVYFATMHAGMLVQAGKREEGRKLFDSLKAPRTDLENYETNRAWFLAVWGDRATFYPQFEKALTMAKDPSILSWVAEDDDLDQYRKEDRFLAAVEGCRNRLLGAGTKPSR